MTTKTTNEITESCLRVLLKNGHNKTTILQSLRAIQIMDMEKSRGKTFEDYLNFVIKLDNP